MPAITKQDILKTLSEVGIEKGDVVQIHTSIKAIGYIEGGPQTVVDALLEAIGPEGTLVAPTFVFARKEMDNPLVDPLTEPGDVGCINEAVRKHPQAVRSIAYTHSFAAIGPKAEWICGADPRLSPFDLKSTFGRLLESDPKILLMGVAYTHCTAGHFCEYLSDVDYRYTYPLPMRILHPDGSIEQITTIQYSPKPDIPYPPRNFNGSGALMEELGLVRITTLGNAYVRCYSMKRYVELVTENFAQGRNILTYAPGQTSGTQLKDGHLIDELYFDEKKQVQVHSVRSVVSLDAVK